VVHAVQVHDRICDVLVPGLAAELAAWLGRLPIAACWDPASRELSWRASLRMPEVADPQLPPCLFQLVDFLEHELGPIAEAIAGRPLRVLEPRVADLRVLRKGSYADGARTDVPAGGMAAVIGLTGACWPAEWGGHTELLGADDVVLLRRAPGWDTLDLVDAGQPLRVPLVLRHVESLAVHAVLAPVPEGA
jgi:hypothetical protein